MSENTPPISFERLFDLPASHTLKTGKTQTTTRDRIVYETCWLDEYDDANNLIARFRTWKNLSLSPPYRRQTGWERYSLNGQLLDREVRYSKRNDMEYVH